MEIRREGDRYVAIHAVGEMVFNADGKTPQEAEEHLKRLFLKDGMAVIYQSGVEPTSSVYSDRLFQWNPEKYNRCSREVWNNEGQDFSARVPDDIEKFLRKYCEKEDLVLCRILQGENQSSGYPVWRFDIVQ